MQKGKIYFDLPDGLTMAFSSDSGELDSNAKQILRAYVPGLRELPGEPAETDIILEHRSADRFKLDGNEASYYVYGSWGEELIADIFHLIYAIVRKHLLARGLFPVHGACVVQNGKAVLILGHSGSGKTTVALKLAADYGMEILSGNKTVVDLRNATMKVTAGTTALSLHERDRQVGAAGGVTYRNRYIFDLEQKELIAPHSIGSICIVRLNDYVQEASRLEKPGLLHTLYPYFLDVVNADVIIGDNVFVGTPPEGSQQMLVKGLAALQNNVYSYTGSAAFVAENIAKL